MTLPRNEIVRYRDVCAEQSEKAQSEGQKVRAAKFCDLRIALDGLLESVLGDKLVEKIFTKIHSDIHRLLKNPDSAVTLDETR